MIKTPCECVVAGFCKRHNIVKHSHYLRLCQEKPAYFRAWEEGRGVGQTKPERIVTSGYNHWAPLHYYAVKHWDDWNPETARRWYQVWKRGIPKTGCGCASTWKTETQVLAPEFSSAKAFFEWSWLIHDSVSERLGKQYRPSLTESYAIWFGILD